MRNVLLHECFGNDDGLLSGTLTDDPRRLPALLATLLPEQDDAV
jgi:hypothetical protein